MREAYLCHFASDQFYLGFKCNSNICMEWGEKIRESAFMLKKFQEYAGHFRRVDKSDTSHGV